VRKASRSKGQVIQPLEERIKAEESIHDSCGPGCRFFLATSKMISKVVKIEYE